MLLVKAKIKHTKEKGFGLFADQEIKKGTIVWEFNGDFDKRITKAEFETLPKDRQFFIKDHGYLEPDGIYTVPLDESQFINHSSDPNLVSSEPEDGISYCDTATRDIMIDEEITIDYTTFDAHLSNGLDFVEK